MSQPLTPLQATLEHLRSVAKLGERDFQDERFGQVLGILIEEQEETYPVYQLSLPDGYTWRNIRSGPDGEIVGRMHDGDKVEITIERVNSDGLEFGKIRLFWPKGGASESNQFQDNWVYMGGMSMVQAGTKVWTSGVDLSEWNVVNNFNMLIEAGYKFAFCKATQGDFGRDPRHHDFMSRAEDAGFFYAPYHFWNNGSGIMQAQNFATYANRGNMRPMLDWERVGADLREVLLFLSETERVFGKKPIIYSNYNIINQYVIEYGTIEWLNDYPFWVASWSDVAERPVMPPGVNDWSIWQHSCKGQPPGTEGYVDLNRFNGSYTELKEFV